MIIYPLGSDPHLPITWFYRDTPNPVRLAFDRNSWCWYRFEPDGTPVSRRRHYSAQMHSQARSLALGNPGLSRKDEGAID